MLRETPIANLWGIFVMLSVGWMPGYLVFNATGPVKYRGKNANHFSPSAVFFKPDEYWLIVQTDIAFFACVGLLGYAIYTFGKRNNLKMIVLLRLVTSACCLRVLDCVFLLFDSFHDHQSVLGAHHIPATHRCFHAAFPQQGMVRKHDRSACYLFLGACMKQCCMSVSRNWLRGALCTVDRSFGWLLNRTLHHITDTHVCHHLFSKMPFYHAQAMKELQFTLPVVRCNVNCM